jgi:hypothetical protein
MMNYRQPSVSERKQIRLLCHDIGAVEVLRVIGNIIQNDHPDLTTGQEVRAALWAVAKQLDSSSN